MGISVFQGLPTGTVKGGGYVVQEARPSPPTPTRLPVLRGEMKLGFTHFRAVKQKKD